MMNVVGWSWAASEDLVAERREQARELVGLRLSSVVYVLLDYGQPDRAVGSGPRLIESAAELASPTWRCESFDWTDYAVELATTAGRVFTISWDSPGFHEGIWLRELPALGTACQQDANVALWDVSHAGRWDKFIGAEITDVILHYRPVRDDGYWCLRITLGFDDQLVHLMLGDANADYRLVPSADNIAVVFPSGPLPDWACHDD